MARSTKTADGLTEKQERFCIEYVDNGGNASEAYRVCYDTSSMQSATINREASRLLQNHKITTRVEEIKQSRADRAQRGRDIINNALLDIVETTTDDLYEGSNQSSSFSYQYIIYPLITLCHITYITNR